MRGTEIGAEVAKAVRQLLVGPFICVAAVGDRRTRMLRLRLLPKMGASGCCDVPVKLRLDLCKELGPCTFKLKV